MLPAPTWPPENPDLRKKENVAPPAPTPEMKRGMVHQGAPDHTLPLPLKLEACPPCSRLQVSGGLATPALCPLLSLVSVLLRQLQVNLGYSASRAVSGGLETTESATGPGPVAVVPPPLLHAPRLCRGHLFSTGLLICLTRSRPTAFLITAKPESPVLPTHNKNHLIKQFITIEIAA